MNRHILTRLAAAAAATMMVFGSVQAADKAVSDKDDFYQAVNGKILETKQIEPTEPSWSWFSEQSQANKKILKKELQGIAVKEGTYTKGTPEQKIADLYQCAMDTKKRNAVSPVYFDTVLAPVRAAGTTAELTQALCDIRQHYGLVGFVGYMVDKTPDSPRYIARINVNGTVLGKYELEKEAYPGAWKAYTDYVSKVLQRGGYSAADAAVQSQQILAMEQSWAPAMLSSEDKNNITVINTLVSRKDIEKSMPNMDGKKLLRSWGLNKENKFFLADKAYLGKLDAAYTQDNMPFLKSYIIFRTMDALAPYADIPLRDIQRSYTMARYGIRQSRSDEETASRMVQFLLPYEFGQIYMKENCTPETVQNVKTMIKEVCAVYRNRLQHNDWLSAKTRNRAIKKLNTLRAFVGGPAADDTPLLEDMPDVISQAEGGDLLGNILHNATITQEEVHRLIGTDFNPDKWYAFQPQDVNAAYIMENNSITIPAGILKAPFYDSGASEGANLGGIGVVIGHEISHAFDPNGSKYDENGNMKNWWNRQDYEAFQKKAAAFEPYYDKYIIGKGIHEKGSLVANEAIADCGGLSVATEIAGGNRDTLRGLYKNFAYIFASKMTDQMIQQLVQCDPHPIGSARVNGALSATDAFYGAYDIAAGDGMYIKPDSRVRLW
ncbi:MAG: M13 family metallopeptidase [Megasphaera sp.]|jgi:putative endopeptidase|nr:M13 family metallopeptidase [Megasphaera sp.]MCI1248180.1 M13 family metallopeptidase [Megasphaera sp.]